jgi:hypothetical protein
MQVLVEVKVLAVYTKATEGLLAGLQDGSLGITYLINDMHNSISDKDIWTDYSCIPIEYRDSLSCNADIESGARSCLVGRSREEERAIRCKALDYMRVNEASNLSWAESRVTVKAGKERSIIRGEHRDTRSRIASGVRTSQ